MIAGTLRFWSSYSIANDIPAYYDQNFTEYSNIFAISYALALAITGIICNIASGVICDRWE